MKGLPYQEGSCFAIPLRTGGFARGVVARMAPKGKVLLAYFFGPKLDIVPRLSEVDGLKAENAIQHLMVGDLGLINGEWPVLGAKTNWSLAEWPMRPLVRRDELSKRAWLVHYADADPNRVEREEPVPFEISGFGKADLYGYGAAEILLTNLLQRK